MDSFKNKRTHGTRWFQKVVFTKSKGRNVNINKVSKKLWMPYIRKKYQSINHTQLQAMNYNIDANLESCFKVISQLPVYVNEVTTITTTILCKSHLCMFTTYTLFHWCLAK